MARDGLADRTRLHVHRVVFTLLKHATQWGVISRNVASLVDAPRVKALELEILTPEEIRLSSRPSRRNRSTPSWRRRSAAA